MRILLAAAVLAGCGGGVDYTATVGWDPVTDPEIQSFTVDGHAATSFYTLARTFDDFADATAYVAAVDVTTTAGVVSFTLTPTMCGGNCGKPGMPSCSDVLSETETWGFYRGVLTAAPADDPLELAADEGQCDFGSGDQIGWAD